MAHLGSHVIVGGGELDIGVAPKAHEVKLKVKRAHNRKRERARDHTQGGSKARQRGLAYEKVGGGATMGPS